MIEAEIEAIVTQRSQASLAQRMAARLKMAIYRKRVRAYAACFCDEQGDLTESGKLVLADLGRLAGLGVARLGRSTEETHFDEGQRRIVLHIIANLRIDEAKMARWARQLRENDE